VDAARAGVTASVEAQTAYAASAIDNFGRVKFFTDSWTLAIDKQREAVAKSDPIYSRDLGLIEQLGQAFGDVSKIPPIDIQLLINNQDPTASLAVILSGLGQVETVFQNLGKSLAGLGTPGSGAAASTDSSRNSLSIQAQYAAQNLQTDIVSGKTHSLLTAAAKLAITQLQQGIALAQSQQQDLNAQMVDAVAQGAIAVEQSIASAQQNFITIGTSIATDIGTYIDQPLTAAGNALQLQADRIANIQQGLVTRFARSEGP